jgi:hypothetical protein
VTGAPREPAPLTAEQEAHIKSTIAGFWLGDTDDRYQDGLLYHDLLPAVLATLDATRSQLEQAQSSLASLADCINTALRENGPINVLQISHEADDMRSFVHMLVDLVAAGQKWRDSRELEQAQGRMEDRDEIIETQRGEVREAQREIAEREKALLAAIRQNAAVIEQRDEAQRECASLKLSYQACENLRQDGNDRITRCGIKYNEMLQQRDAARVEAKKLREALDTERLAAIAHDQWMTWANAVLSEVHDTRRMRWRKLMVPYVKLSEEMKEHDRKWARIINGAALSTPPAQEGKP